MPRSTVLPLWLFHLLASLLPCQEESAVLGVVGCNSVALARTGTELVDLPVEPVVEPLRLHLGVPVVQLVFHLRDPQGR